MGSCEKCNNGKLVVKPSIYKCQLTGKTMMYYQGCEKWEPKQGFDILDFFDKEIFKNKESKNDKTI